MIFFMNTFWSDDEYIDLMLMCLYGNLCTALKAVVARPDNQLFFIIVMIMITEMEKRADAADASVLFFLLGCANLLAVHTQTS